MIRVVTKRPIASLSSSRPISRIVSNRPRASNFKIYNYNPDYVVILSDYFAEDYVEAV